MRAILFFVIFAIGIAFHSLPVMAAHGPWCLGLFPVDIIDCKDDRLFKLHNEVEDLYSKAISAAQGQRRQALIAQRSRWFITRGRKCGVPVVELVTERAVRKAHPCLINLYETHIAELSKLVSPVTAQVPFLMQLLSQMRLPLSAVPQPSTPRLAILVRLTWRAQNVSGSNKSSNAKSAMTSFLRRTIVRMIPSDDTIPRSKKASGRGITSQTRTAMMVTWPSSMAYFALRETIAGALV